MELYNAGKKIDDIEIKISYKIIELFSAGLYSSPNKAFEELVCNSYDAFADKVSVYVPSDLAADGAFIWVCDNGEGLDPKELKDLWLIGESKKRSDPSRDKKRLQVGQFGIGKLSTYILAQNLTYLSKKDGRYIVATMDYNLIGKSEDSLTIEERELTEEEAERILNKYVHIGGKYLISFDLFGSKAPDTWTISILTNLKPKAKEIREGRLKWILKTALPLNPQFNLYYNGSKLESSKIKNRVIKEWSIGKDDVTAESLDYAECRCDNGNCFVDFEYLKNVSGKFTLHEDSLLEGKSGEVGRSHGIFLMIRGRLVNLDDPLLGMDAFSHGAFNRTRIVINADELDSNLTSTRESVKDSLPYDQLKGYIKKKFNNEIKKFYFDQENKKETEGSLAYRLAQTPYSTTKKPIHSFIQLFFAGKIINPFLIEKPESGSEDELLSYYDISSSTEEFFDEVVFSPLDSGSPIAKFNLLKKTLIINSIHPFIANNMNSYRNTLPMESIAMTEVLTEAHLYELRIDEDLINRVMRKRDNTLRQLALSDRQGIPAVAQLLRDTIASPTGLEEAVYRAFLALGFEASKIGGNGKPDGRADAILGYKSDKCINYSITYEVKSTSKNRISAEAARLSAVRRHREDYSSTFAVEIAIGFEGEDDPESAVNKEAVQQKVTLIRVVDLVRLLFLAPPKQIGLRELRGLFEVYTTIDVTKWIDEIEQRDTVNGPFSELVDVVYELQKNDLESPTLSVVRMKYNEKYNGRLSTKDVEKLFNSLCTLVSGFVHVDGDHVYVGATPDAINAALNKSINSDVPFDLQKIYIDAFKS